MLHTLSLMARSDRGQSLVEYALILSLVAIVAVIGLRALGAKANNSLLAPAAQWAP